MKKTALKYCQASSWMKQKQVAFSHWFAGQTIRVLFLRAIIIYYFILLTVSVQGQTSNQERPSYSESGSLSRSENSVYLENFDDSSFVLRPSNRLIRNTKTNGQASFGVPNSEKQYSDPSGNGNVSLGNEQVYFKTNSQNANTQNDNIRSVRVDLVAQDSETAQNLSDQSIQNVERPLITSRETTDSSPLSSATLGPGGYEGPQTPKKIISYQKNVMKTNNMIATNNAIATNNIIIANQINSTVRSDQQAGTDSGKSRQFIARDQQIIAQRESQPVKRERVIARNQPSSTANQRVIATNQPTSIANQRVIATDQPSSTVNQRVIATDQPSFSTNRQRYLTKDSTAFLSDRSVNQYQEANQQGKIAAKVPENVSQLESPQAFNHSSRSNLTVEVQSNFPNNAAVSVNNNRENNNESGNNADLSTDRNASVYSSDSFAVSSSSRTLTVEDAMNIAMATNRQHQAKIHQTQSAQANIEAAKGIRRPKIANASAYTVMNDPYKIQNDIDLSNLPPAASQMLGQLGIPTSFQLETPVTDKNFATSVTSLTVPLYMGGRAQGMIESANAFANAMEAGTEINELDLKFEVVQSYLLVLRIRKLREVAQEAEITLAAHEADANRLLSNGLVTPNVILAAQVAHAEATQNLLKAQNSVQIAEAAFNRLLWRSLQTPVQINDLEIPETSGELNILTDQAIHQRPELDALSSQEKAISAQEKVQRADRLPQIALVGSHNYVQNSHLDPNSNFTGSVGMAWMPVDGGISRARERSSQFEALAVAKLREDAQTAIELQVYQCWLDEQETRKRVDVAKIAVDQANENLRVVTRSFNEGLVNHTEVLDAQTLKTQAATNLAHAKYDAILATYKIKRACGYF